MSRRETREQNDISIIIGNLPKRLQKKIAEEVGHSCSSGNPRKNGLNSMSVDCRPSSSREVDTSAIQEDGDVANTRVKLVDKGAKVSERDKSGISILTSETLYFETAQFERKANPNSLLRTSRKISDEGAYDKTILGDILREGINPRIHDSSNALTCVADRNEHHKELKGDALTIRGILRVNASDTVKQANENNGVSERGRKIKSPIHKESSYRLDLCAAPIRQQSAKTPLWFEDVDNTNVLVRLHEALVTHMQRESVIDNWTDFCRIHSQLQLFFRQLLLHHLKFCCEQKVDTYFWKLLFYNVRQYLKCHKEAQASAHTLTLIEIGIKYYTDLHSQLTTKYLAVPSLFGEYRHRPHKFETIAKVADQKLLICLGDLSRYKVKQIHLCDYSVAAKYYQQAQCLIPTNGIPYNQLAILAILAHRNFDAIYYHVRSLMSSNAICSAKESLSVLFDDIRKKYEDTDLKTSLNNPSANTNNNNSKSLRKEIWIYPDGVRCLHRTNINKLSISEETTRMPELTADELYRHFSSLYLYIIGKLYTCVGLESIQVHQSKLFLQLELLLQRNILSKSRKKMLKMVALNIFILEYNMYRDTRREVRYHAFNFCNQIFGLILRNCNQMLLVYRDRNVDGCELEEKGLTDLNVSLQFIKIYTDWLAKNVYIWEPKREEQSFVDSWAELERLIAQIKRIKVENYDIDINKDQNQIVLEEDNFFIGFTPLIPLLSQRCEATPSTEIVQFFFRLEQIAKFQKCYEDNQHRLEIPPESKFILEELNNSVEHILNKLHTDDDRANTENTSIDGIETSNNRTETKLDNETNVDDAQMSQLSRLKKELEVKANVKKVYNAKLEEILNFVDSNLCIEVRPKYLLPDTNCFIDCLEDIESLLKEHTSYTLIIPLTVVKELDGLSKGVKLESYKLSLQRHRIHYLDDVSSRAKKSLDFINASTVKNNVKCATSKGSIINASLFGLVEEEKVSNDDKILATALSLSKAMSTEIIKDDKYLIQTELVLITTDRNLRVKALSRNLAVSEFNEFLQWAKQSTT